MVALKNAAATISTVAFRDGSSELTRRLQSLRASVDRLSSARTELSELEPALADLDVRIEELEASVDGERRDVERLEGGVGKLWSRVRGNADERLTRERDEVQVAEEALDLATNERERLRSRQRELSAVLVSLAGAEPELARSRTEKEAWMRSLGGPVTSELDERAAVISRLQAAGAGTDQAMAAGNVALKVLSSVSRSLQSASSWGTLDMIGGGIVTSMAKHSKIDRARSQLARANAAVQEFQRLSRSVSVQIAAVIEMDGMTRFADFFLDDIFSDIAVQSKISRSRKSVAVASGQVRAVLGQLGENRAQIIDQLHAAQRERAYLIETWG